MAQPDNAADSDSEDRGFESLRAGQKIRLVKTSRIFLSIAKAMEYHHALACISSRAAMPPLYLITPLGVYQKFFRIDYINTCGVI